jgi:hypothetical protein
MGSPTRMSTTHASRSSCWARRENAYQSSQLSLGLAKASSHTFVAISSSALSLSLASSPPSCASYSFLLTSRRSAPFLARTVSIWLVCFCLPLPPRTTYLSPIRSICRSCHDGCQSRFQYRSHPSGLPAPLRNCDGSNGSVRSYLLSVTGCKKSTGQGRSPLLISRTSQISRSFQRPGPTFSSHSFR